FLAMAGAVRQAGIVVSDAAQRLSLLIPLAAAFLLFGEAASAAKLGGMMVALAALTCLIWQRRARGPAASGTASANPKGFAASTASASTASANPAAGQAPRSSAAKTLGLLLCVW